MYVCACMRVVFESDSTQQSFYPGLPRYVHQVYTTAANLGEQTPLIYEAKLRASLGHLSPYVLNRSLSELNASGPSQTPHKHNTTHTQHVHAHTRVSVCVRLSVCV